MLKNFFNHFYFEEYVPHAKHMVYPSLMVLVGGVCLRQYGQYIKQGQDVTYLSVLALIYIIGGCLFGIVIMLGIAWRGPIEYWKQIENVIALLVKAPQVWQQIKGIPEMLTVKQYIDKSDQGMNTLPAIVYNKIPAKEIITLNLIANKVIGSGSLVFTEDKFKNIPNFRKWQNKFKQDGLIVKESKHPKSRYVFNRKGVTHLFQYADEAIKLQAQKEGK